MCRKPVVLALLTAALTLITGTAAFGFDALSDPALIGWWSCDEGSGDLVADSSKNHNDGKFYQGASAWVPGVHGTAVELRKPTLVQIPAINKSLSEATMAGWIKAYGAQTEWAAIMMMRPTATGLNILADYQIAYHWNDGSNTWGFRSQLKVANNEWSFAAVTVTPSQAMIYLNGTESATNAASHSAVNFSAALCLGGDGSGSFDDRRMVGALDDVSLWSRALTQDEIKAIMLGPSKPGPAGSPAPVSGATDVPRDVVLSWQAGPWAKTHDIYLGTTFDDVNNAGPGSPLLVSKGQEAVDYDPVGLLAYGQTYFWRIDEINAPPTDSTVFKGSTWSFQAEPYAYPITSLKATASSSLGPTMGPEKTIDRSGMDSLDQHGTSASFMWLSKKNVSPIWIQYEFGAACKLWEMWVWNSNQAVEPAVGFGAKDVTVETSLDGTTWTAVKDVPEFAQATGEPNYTHSTTVGFGGVEAKYVKLTIKMNWADGTKQAGLSEVRFFYVPVKAYAPQPASGSTGVAIDSVLNWRPGRDAAKHDVYLSMDANAVAQGTAPVKTVTQHSLALGSLGLEYGRTYYWKVNEVNDAATPKSSEGDVWSFTTPDYGVVDDFEAYNDNCKRVFFAWVDGFGHGGSADCGVAPDGGNNTGSTVGNTNPPFAERTVVHGGQQAMPFAYDNTSGKSTSEAIRTFSTPQDWTAGGAKTLVLFFRGSADNGAGQLYVTINGTKIVYSSANALSLPPWKQWNIDLASVGTNLKAVKTLAIGVSGSGKGVLYVDDIRLYRVAPAVAVPVDPGANGLAAYYGFNGDVKDSSGRGLNGTANGDPIYVPSLGAFGQAMQLEGIDDHVDLPIGTLLSTLTSSSYAVWVNLASSTSSWQRAFDFGNDTNVYMFLCPRTGTNGPVRYAITTTSGAGESAVVSPSALIPGWHQLTVVIDGPSKTMQLYLDGDMVNSGTTNTLPSGLGKTTQNWVGRSQYTADGYYNGLLDELRIYSRALTAGEVRYLAGDR